MENTKLPIVWRILYFVVMIIFLGPALLAGALVLKSFITSGSDWFSLLVSIVSALAFGWTAYLFGYKVFMPIARHGWIKNKIIFTAPLALVWAFLLASVAMVPFNQYKARAYNSDAKANLHSMFVTCQAYWLENGDDQNCDLKTAAQKEYGFVPSEHVSINGKGTAKDFTATAHHEAGTQSFMIDFQGNISEQPQP